MNMLKFPHPTLKEFSIFKKLNSPSKIQDFLDLIPINFEKRGETSYSPFMVLKHNKAHCIEGAMLAAAMFWYHGERPLLLDLKTTNDDEDHVVTLFQRNNRWGAVSKTNHAVLRFRDPVYASVRELAMSYFNEYFLNNGKKTMRSYSTPFDLSRKNADWLISPNHQWHISDALDSSPHFKILEHRETRLLRKADPTEIKAGTLVEWKRK